MKFLIGIKLLDYLLLLCAKKFKNQLFCLIVYYAPREIRTEPWPVLLWLIKTG